MEGNGKELSSNMPFGSADGYAPITPTPFRRCRTFVVAAAPSGPDRQSSARCASSAPAETTNHRSCLPRSGQTNNPPAVLTPTPPKPTVRQSHPRQ